MLTGDHGWQIPLLFLLLLLVPPPLPPPPPQQLSLGWSHPCRVEPVSVVRAHGVRIPLPVTCCLRNGTVAITTNLEATIRSGV